MAISKISQYNSSPTAVSDYQAQNEHLQAFINQLNSGAFILAQASTSSVPYIAQGTYIQFGGTVYIVDTEDYTIQGSVTSGSTNYIYLTESGDNLVATWTTNISSYSWNSVYGYYTDGTNILLSYVVNYSGSNYYLSTFNRMFNQAVKTDSDVEFANINIGVGLGISSPLEIRTANENGVNIGSTSSYLRFSPIGNGNADYVVKDFKFNHSTESWQFDANVEFTTSPTSGSYEFDGSSTWTLPRGVYQLNYPTAPSSLKITYDGTNYYENVGRQLVFADGSNVKIRFTGTTTIDLDYYKF